jgi:thymidine kinase
MQAVGAQHLSDIGDSYKDFDVIGIDEGQFFNDVITPTPISNLHYR